MPQQFRQADKPAPLQIGVSEPFALPTVAETTSAPRYTSDEVKSILEEAARLQTYYRETLSQTEVEAIAQDVGIEPKFVRQAIEQVSAPQTITPRHRKRLPRLEPLPFHAVAKTAMLPILYASLLIPITSWRPESGFANWFLFLYMVLPPLIAFSTGFLLKRTRMGAVSGAFWGMGILFALSLPFFVKVYQDFGGFNYPEMYGMVRDTGMFLVLFMLYGAACGVSGAFAWHGVEKARKWYGKRRSNKTGATRAALRGI